MIMIERLLDWFAETETDPVVKLAREGVEDVNYIRLEAGTVVDVLKIHAGLPIGKIFKFGLVHPDDAISIYEGVFGGWHRHKGKFKPKGRAAMHTHKFGSPERLTVMAGVLVVYLGTEKFVLRKGDSKTFSGAMPHGMKALNQETDVLIEVQKID